MLTHKSCSGDFNIDLLVMPCGIEPVQRNIDYSNMVVLFNMLF